MLCVCLSFSLTDPRILFPCNFHTLLHIHSHTHTLFHSFSQTFTHPYIISLSLLDTLWTHKTFFKMSILFYWMSPKPLLNVSVFVKINDAVTYCLSDVFSKSQSKFFTLFFLRCVETCQIMRQNAPCVFFGLTR
jgi:hypothetical protein